MKINFKNHVLNGGVFSIQYSKYGFTGNLEEFVDKCRNFIDYAHHNNNYFDCAVCITGKEIPIEKGFKKILLDALKES